MSLLAAAYRMKTTRPHIFLVPCDVCRGRGCGKCERGKIQIVQHVIDPRRVALRRLFIGACLAAAIVAIILIFK